MRRAAATADPSGASDAAGLGIAGLSAPWSAPLAHRNVCRSTDLDVFRDRLNGLFYPARVETLGSRARLRGSWLSGLRLTHLTLGFVRFGAEASVDPGPLGAYHVNVPLAGHVESVCGDRRAVASPMHGTMFSPDAYSVLPRWSTDAAQLCIKIRRRSLESEVTALLGRSPGSSVDFELAYDLTTPAARSWLATLGLLLTELDSPGSLAETSIAHREHLERLVISGLLLAQPNELTAKLTAPQRPLRPRTVARVIALIEEHPEQPYLVGDLARHAGVSARRLQQGFHDHVGMSPTEFLRRTRLERAHRDLLSGDDPVTDVALRWGFSHLGRFARAYREQFGMLPSDTRRASSA
jgi:AraC-like DNA-binding protein